MTLRRQKEATELLEQSSRSHAIVCVNGEFTQTEKSRFLNEFSTPGDLQGAFVVAVDGGLRHAINLGLTVDWLIGDLDSVNEHSLDAPLVATARVIRFPSEKDATDLELALRELAKLEFDCVTIVGLTGGRLDHALANLLLIARSEWPFQIRFGSAEGWAQLITRDYPLTGAMPIDSIVSLLPVDTSVEGVTTRGLYYPLEDATLLLGSTLGISNLVGDERAVDGEHAASKAVEHLSSVTDVVVTVRQGQLLAIVHPPEKAQLL